jgi:CcmD family protein
MILQNPALVGSFRPYLFVLLAFAAAWILIGAFVLRIGRKVNRLADRMEEDDRPD